MSEITELLKAVLENANEQEQAGEETYIPLNGAAVIRAALAKMGVGVNEISEGRAE